MDCNYCGKEMQTTSFDTCNGWECPGCKHREPEMGGWRLGGEQPGQDFPCNCLGCVFETLGKVKGRDYTKSVAKEIGGLIVKVNTLLDDAESLHERTPDFEIILDQLRKIRIILHDKHKYYLSKEGQDAKG